MAGRQARPRCTVHVINNTFINAYDKKIKENQG
jgi:hypothetical protein